MSLYRKLKCNYNQTISCIYPVLLDPRQWSRNDVKLWLQTASVQHQLLNTFPEKFPMNGKGLLLLTRDMFIERVPVGGALLYEDLHLKVQKMVSDQLRQVQELELMLHPGVINH